MILLGFPAPLVFIELWLLLCVPSAIGMGAIYWIEEGPHRAGARE